MNNTLQKSKVVLAIIFVWLVAVALFLIQSWK